MEKQRQKDEFYKSVSSDNFLQEFFKTQNCPIEALAQREKKKVENTTQFTNFFQIANNGV